MMPKPSVPESQGSGGKDGIFSFSCQSWLLFNGPCVPICAEMGKCVTLKLFWRHLKGRKSLPIPVVL